MKTHLSYSLFAGILVAFFACQNQPQTTALEVIPVEAAYQQLSEIRASDCFSEIRYIPLETSDSVLIGSEPSILSAGNRLIVMSGQKQCFSFDKQTGRFVASIGHIGNDPQGSLSLTGRLNERDRLLYFSAGNGREVVYNLEGNFQGDTRSIDVTDGLYGVDSYTWLAKDLQAAHFPATHEKPDRIVVYRDTTVVCTFPSKGETLSSVSGSTEDIENIQVFQKLLCGQGAIYIQFKDKQTKLIVPSADPFWHVGEQLYFKELFNDTIYEVQPDGLTPARLLDLGNFHWPSSERHDVEKDRAIYPLDIWENANLLLMRFAVHAYHPDKPESYNLVYHKQKRQAQAAPFQEGISNDLTHFLPLQPSYANAEGEFFQLLSAEEIADWFDSHPEAANLPSEVEQLRHLTPDDNPVVVIMK